MAKIMSGLLNLQVSREEEELNALISWMKSKINLTAKKINGLLKNI
jgi:hypothetical protein